MAELGNLEALKWIERPDGKERGISASGGARLIDKQFRSLVKELYDAGATGVVAMDVCDFGDTEDGSQLKVTLPSDLSARQKLFQIQVRALESMGSELPPETERGQDSFMLGW